MRPDPFAIHSRHYSSSSASSSITVSYKVRHYPFNPFLAAKPTGGTRARWARMEYSSPSAAASPAGRRHNRHRKDKLVVIMGATGTGKSRLSIDLAAHFPVEVINSDKMQVYKGLDITTNKILVHERRGVPHHLLGEIDPARGDLTPAEFRFLAGKAVADIAARRKLPVLVGGSNSFIHALVVDRFDPDSNVFEEGPHSAAAKVSTELRYNCCFLWVDVSLKVLTDYLAKRVDDMLDSGMFDELTEFYDPDEDHDESAVQTGLRKAIGVPEFDRYFQKYYYRPGNGENDDSRTKTTNDGSVRDRMRSVAFEEAVRAIKDNTCQLAKRQIGKMLRLKGSGWDLRRLDATEVFRAVMTSDCGECCSEIWERQVLEPSVKIVKRFLDE